MKISNFFSPRIIIFLAVIFCFGTVSFAQNAVDALRLGESGLGFDARALGMGNSYIGLSDGSGAAFFNPAGWGLLKSIEFTGGLNYNSFNNNTTFFGNNSSYSNSATRLSNLSIALPFPTVRGSMVFAVSYHTTKDFTGALKFDGYNGTNTSMIQDLNSSVYYDNNNNPYNIPFDLYLTGATFLNLPNEQFQTNLNGHLNQSGTILESGSLHNWTFSGAIEASKNLFLGLNLNFISGSYNNNNSYYEDDTHGIYSNQYLGNGDSSTYGFQTFYLNRVLNWDLSGWNLKFGLLYQIQNKARIGFTIQFPKTYTVKESYTVNGYSQFSVGRYDLNSSDYSDNVKYDIVTPYELGAGLSYNLEGLILSGQATLIDYTQLKFDNADGLGTDYVNKQNKYIKDYLRSVLNFNIGAEYTFPLVGLRLRAGYFVKPSPYQGDPFSFGKQYITGGVGFLTGGNAEFDVAYAHGWWDTYGDNYGPYTINNTVVAVSRTYQTIKDNRIILSMTYRF